MTTLVTVFLISLIAFGLVICGMAVGVIMGRRAISGSCGGLANQSAEDGQTSCSLCSNPEAACRELGRRMQGNPHPQNVADQNSVERSSTIPDCDLDCETQGCSKEAIDACKAP